MVAEMKLLQRNKDLSLTIDIANLIKTVRYFFCDSREKSMTAAGKYLSSIHNFIIVGLFIFSLG